MNTKLRQKIREPLSINNNMIEDTILRLLHTISRHNNLFPSRPTNKVTKKKKMKPLVIEHHMETLKAQSTSK